jgi:hypothetical protein
MKRERERESKEEKEKKIPTTNKGILIMYSNCFLILQLAYEKEKMLYSSLSDKVA